MSYPEKTISAVVITYKEFSYIYETLDSIFAQDYPAIEIVVTDDGSPEFPEEKLRGYIESHKGENIVGYVLAHSPENVGTVKNINEGIRRSSGDFIKIIAGDDAYYDGHVFSAQMACFDRDPDLMIVTGRICECNEKMQPIYKEQVESTNKALPTIFSMEPKAYFKRCKKEHLFPLVTQALLIRKSFFEQYGCYDERYCLLEDPPMEKRIIISRVPVAAADCTVVKHRASVGVSANEQFFAKKQSKYFLDLVNYVKNELMTRPEYFPPFRTKQRYKREWFRYRMSVAESQKEKLLLAIQNVGTAFWFVILNPSRAWDKVRRVFKRTTKR
ncbi:MAG: glycosyltransferase family 2 protein [Oscillospiraceae bacterium]|nr:glycosyltransferase family 2 protein [Oscillospiraceae bacterium]